MTLKLVVTTNAEGDVYELVLKNDRYTVGRRSDNDLRIKETYISGYHAELVRGEDGNYLLADLGSSNGTFLNGRRISGKEAVKAGDFIKFGILKVAVKEHTGATPKIVSLRHHPAFAPKEIPDPPTGAVVSKVEDRSTTSVRTGASTPAPKIGTPVSAEPSNQESGERLASRISELESSLKLEKEYARGLLESRDKLEAEIALSKEQLAKLEAESGRLLSGSEDTVRRHDRLRDELEKESAERLRIAGELEASRSRVSALVSELEQVRMDLVARDLELTQIRQEKSRVECEEIRRLKRELVEAITVREASEEKADKAVKERLVLSGSFERLKEQLSRTEASLQQAKSQEENLTRNREILEARLEAADAANRDLTSRIQEEAMAAIASRNLIEKLQLQLRESETEAARREREAAAAMQAETSRAQRKAAEDDRARRTLEAELARSAELRHRMEEQNTTLENRVVALEGELASVKSLLSETENRRSDLASRLESEKALALSHARTIEGLRSQLSGTIGRFQEAEKSLQQQSETEIDALVSELKRERGLKESLATLLDHTREGLSAALRNAREESARIQAKLVADHHASLAAAADELGLAIRTREETEAARCALEDDLNRREEDIERLSERLEDLQIALADEIESRTMIERGLQTTREGFSDSLRALRDRLERSEATCSEERAQREELLRALAAAQKEIVLLQAASEEGGSRHREEIRNWENRYEALREEKLTIAGEDANLRQVRERLEGALAEKNRIEAEIGTLGSDLETLRDQRCELQAQRESLLREREELKAGLNAARAELSQLQKRCHASHDEEGKLTEMITAAERRIQALRKLESEMEQAIERRRQQNLLSRGEVFSGTPESRPDREEFSPEDFYRKLISKVDLIDDLAKRYESRWLYPKVAEQLGILKRSFLELLQDHSVRQFDLEPGTVVSLAERRRIKLIPLQNGNGRNPHGNGVHASKVVETIRPGYIFQDGSRDVVIRKAEVLVS